MPASGRAISVIREALRGSGASADELALHDHMITDPWFYLAAVPAVIILGLAKGGFAGIGTLATPIVALAIPPVQAASILLPILVVQDVYSVLIYRRHWDAFNLRVLLPGAFIGVGAGYVLASRLPEAGVGFAVGAISIAFGLRQLLQRSAKPPPARRPNAAAGWFW